MICVYTYIYTAYKGDQISFLENMHAILTQSINRWVFYGMKVRSTIMIFFFDGSFARPCVRADIKFEAPQSSDSDGSFR